MKYTIDINETIKVTIQPQPKKKKGHESLYDIYIHSTIFENGVSTLTPVAFSTGLYCEVKHWNKKMQCKAGRNGEDFNNELNRKLNLTKLHLEVFRNEGVKTCTQVRDEIQTNVRTRVTGKAQWGKKDEQTERQKKKTVDAVLNDLIEQRAVSPGRQRIYRHAAGILHRYFNYATPLITNISEQDLTEFKTWYMKNYRCEHGKRKGLPPAQDSTTTWFTMIAALFKHAEKKMKILHQSPLPEKFRGSFADHEKPVLNEDESLQIINLDEATLTRSELVAKLSLVTCLTTGMGYGDLSSLTKEHLKRDNKAGKWYINKPRNKTGKAFKVYLTPRAEQNLYRLRELVGGKENLLDLPTIDYTNRMYKKLSIKAGVQTHVTTYTLRHSYGVHYMDNNGRLEDLKVMLGNDWRNVEKYGRISNKRLVEKTSELEQNSKIHQLHQV